MKKKKYTWELWEDKTGIQLDTGSFSSYNEEYKRPSDVRFPYISYTTFLVFDEDGVLKERVQRKQTVPDLPKYLLPGGTYTINREWRSIESWILDYGEYSEQTYEEIVNPAFKRNHVWGQKQQIGYVEHILKGGRSGKDIYFNCPSWQTSHEASKDMFCIDGLQRITAVVDFLHNKFSVFNNIYYDDLDRIPNLICCFNLHILDFKTEEDILTWYLDMNSAGTPHTEEELDRVRKMKENLND